jgi:hypothetical protein
MTHTKEETMQTPTDRQLRDVLTLAAVERPGWEAASARLRASGVPLNDGSDPQLPVAQPLGGATVNGTTVTVDTYVNPPTKIPAVVRSLVEEDEGYFIERVFGTLGSPVQGGTVIVEETFPEDFFLPEDSRPAPRAPGAEAPRLAGVRREPKVRRPESWSGSIEVTDEARERNNIIAVRKQFTVAANTFADIVQRRGIEVLLDAVSDWGRVAKAKVNWTAVKPNGVQNVDPQKMPHFDLALTMKQFHDDKVGVRPDTMILNTEENLFLDLFYPGIGTTLSVDAILNRYGIRNVFATPLIPKGNVLFAKAGAPGVIGWELPMSQEKERVARRKTDVFILECRPIYAAFDASAVWMLEGTDKDPA